MASVSQLTSAADICLSRLSPPTLRFRRPAHTSRGHCDSELDCRQRGREPLRMPNPSFAELQERAEQHGRHLANMALTLVGLTALLASVAAASITQIESPRATAFDVATIFVPLLAAFVLSLLGTNNQGMPVPNPLAETAASRDEAERLAQLCLSDASRRNAARKTRLIGARFMICVSLVMAFWWLSEHDPTRGLRFQDEPVSAIGSDVVKPESYLAVELHSDEVDKCERTSVIVPEELVQLDFELCPVEPADSRRVAGYLVMLISVLSVPTAGLPRLRVKRAPDTQAALDAGMLIDLEREHDGASADKSAWQPLVHDRRD